MDLYCEMMEINKSIWWSGPTMKPNVSNSLKCYWMPPITCRGHWKPSILSLGILNISLIWSWPGHHPRNQAMKTMAFSTGRNRPQQSPQTISFRSRWIIGWVNGCFWFPLIGGRYHIISQLAVCTTYIPLIYCLLGDYTSPTTY